MTLAFRHATGALQAAALCAGLGLATAASAQISWDLANEYPPGSIHAQTADTFIAAVEEATGGEIDITAHHGAALGFRSADQFDAVGDGAIPIASSFGGTWAGIDPAFLVSSLPFMAASVEDNWALYQATKPYYTKVLEDANQVFLFASPWPPSGLWGKAPLDSLEAISNVRIRTFDANGTITLREAGAAPIQVSWADVVPQLSTGALDGVLTSADGGSSAQLWEHQSHFTEVNYAMPLQFMHMNRDAFNSLNEEQRAAVLAAAETAERKGWDMVVERVGQNYETMRSNGMTVVTDVSPEFLAALSEAAAETRSEWRSRFGEANADALMAAFEAARN